MDAAFAAIDPGVRHVVLAARISAYTSTPQEQRDSFDFVAPSHFVSLDEPELPALEAYERALERDVSALLAGPRDVTLVLEVPALDFSPRDCIRVRPIEVLMSRETIRCSVPRARVEARQASVRAAVSRVAARLANPRLRIVDPMTALCDATECYARIGGVIMYRDDDHLSFEGSRYVWSQIQPRGSQPAR